MTPFDHRWSEDFALPFTIKFSPRTAIAGIKAKTDTRATAAEAWALVQMLDAGEERTEIRDEFGHELSWQELRQLAEKEHH